MPSRIQFVPMILCTRTRWITIRFAIGCQFLNYNFIDLFECDKHKSTEIKSIKIRFKCLNAAFFALKSNRKIKSLFDDGKRKRNK